MLRLGGRLSLSLSTSLALTLPMLSPSSASFFLAEISGDCSFVSVPLCFSLYLNESSSCTWHTVNLSSKRFCKALSRNWRSGVTFWENDVFALCLSDQRSISPSCDKYEHTTKSLAQQKDWNTTNQELTSSLHLLSLKKLKLITAALPFHRVYLLDHFPMGLVFVLRLSQMAAGLNFISAFYSLKLDDGSSQNR